MRFSPRIVPLTVFVSSVACPLAVVASPRTLFTEAQARQKAVQLHPGKIEEVEDEKLGGTPVLSVEVRSGKDVYEVKFRKSDGAVVEDALTRGGDEEDDEREGKGSSATEK